MHHHQYQHPACGQLPQPMPSSHYPNQEQTFHSTSQYHQQSSSSSDMVGINTYLMSSIMFISYDTSFDSAWSFISTATSCRPLLTIVTASMAWTSGNFPSNWSHQLISVWLFFIFFPQVKSHNHIRPVAGQYIASISDSGDEGKLHFLFCRVFFSLVFLLPNHPIPPVIYKHQVNQIMVI